jgi:hypothetical protein
MNIDLTKPFSPENIVQDAIYMSYRYNRDRSPDITPEGWQSVFGDTRLMEVRYQRERNEV